MSVLERLSDHDTRKYAGQWVAVKDGKILFAAVDAQDVIAWVEKNGASPDLVFSIPTENEAASWYF